MPTQFTILITILTVFGSINLLAFIYNLLTKNYGQVFPNISSALFASLYIYLVLSGYNSLT